MCERVSTTAPSCPWRGSGPLKPCVVPASLTANSAGARQCLPSSGGGDLARWPKLGMAVSFLNSVKRQQQLSHSPETNAYRTVDSSAPPDRF